MKAAVQRRLDPERDHWISLSGGRDSMGVAAAVHALGFEGMRGFTYVTGSPREGGDAWIAAKAAEAAGIEHRVVSSDPDDVLTAFRACAALSEACAWPAHEVAAWTRVGPAIQAGHRPTLFVGDDRMGTTSPAR